MTEDGKGISVLDFYVNWFVHGNPRPGNLFKRATILKEQLTHSRLVRAKTFDVENKAGKRLTTEQKPVR